MPGEPSDNDQVWWTPAEEPEPADQEEPSTRAGWRHAAGPIGHTGLRPRSRPPYLIAGVAVAALLGGSGAALAATNSPAPAASSSAVIANSSPSPGQAPPPGVGLRRSGWRPGLGSYLFGALHGQFVVGKAGGGYQTVAVQNGQVTAVRATSVTLRSADGFTRSYVIASSTLVDAQRDGIGSVKVGDRAAVQATVSGGTAIATSIEDLTMLRHTYGPGRPGGVGALGG